ncbi:MAG: hypothetical protein AAGD43_03265 [Pseudomonadota bacterium]
MPWQKGESGNPGGRPKAETEIKRRAQALGADCIEFLEAVLRGKPWPPVDDVDERSYPWKPEARLTACKELLDRGFGKAKAPIEVNRSPEEMTDEELDAAIEAELAERGLELRPIADRLN